MREQETTQSSPKQSRFKALWGVAVIGVLLSPALGALVGLVRVTRTWRILVFSLSLLLNVLFGVVLFVAYYEANYSQLLPRNRNIRALDDLVPAEDVPISFFRAMAGSALDQETPNSVYLISEGRLCASFGYESPDLTGLATASLSDTRGRTWIMVDHRDKSVSVDLYLTDFESPSESLLDRDGDGIPDTRIDWSTSIGYTRDSPIQWRELERK